jgi:UDP-2-acetamido-2-deoxy-ribo-hexuluronate aminotransferase
MKFIDLEKQQQRIRVGIERRIRGVLDHGNYIMGPEVIELETALSCFVNVKHCISCGNGTDALLMAMMAYGIGPGDAVFTTPFTFIATAEMISLLGATPVFVDIDERTFNLAPAALSKVLEDFLHGKLPNGKSVAGLTPKAVIAVDLFGLPADYEALERISKDHSLILIEDGAQSFGGSHGDRMACSFGDVATTSFFPAKPLGCYGDGGAIFTNNDNIAETMRSIRIHGKGTDKYDNIRIGINGRLDTLQAAILLEKLTIFPEEIELRQSVARNYSNLIKPPVQIPYVPEKYKSAWAQYSIVVEGRDDLMKKLQAAGIPSMIYYPKPLHLQRAFAYLDYPCGLMPVAEKISETIVSLPMYPYISSEDQDRIVEIVNRYSTSMTES